MPSATDIGRFAVAVPFVVVARIVLIVWSPSRWTRQIDFGASAPKAAPTNASVRALPWAIAVSRAASRVPGSKCIVQALALKWLLFLMGIVGLIRVGVSRPRGGDFASHAWLEVDGVRVLDTDPRQSHVELRIDA